MSTILDTIGHTPILRLSRLEASGGAELYAKYEAGNPSLSVKDRIALPLIEQAEQQGKIQSDTQIVVATYGNTGVALGLVCAVKKLALVLFMPEDASLERRKMFEGFGAQLKITPKEEGLKGAMKQAEDYCEKNSNTFLVDQFDCQAVVDAHYNDTAAEIIADFPQGVDALVLTIGTGGTLTGVGKRLKETFPHLKIIAVEPENPKEHKIQQISQGFTPQNLDSSLIDQTIKLSDDSAYDMTRELAQKQGVLLGISSGANVWAAKKVSEDLGKEKKVLTFLCDAGQRYFSIIGASVAPSIGKANGASPSSARGA